MKPPSATLLKKVAIEAADQAGKVLKRHFRKKLTIKEKPGEGCVSNADLESQEVVVKYLRKKTPHFGFLTEEAPAENPEALGQWILDPLDGTTNYIRGFPHFCVSLAATWRSELYIGVIYHPLLNEAYWAIRGKGAYRNQKPISVSNTPSLSQAFLSTGFSYQKKLLLREVPLFQKASELAMAVRRSGSAALDLAYTACGIFDGYWERNLRPWDTAAGALLVQEAKGHCTDFQGRPFDPIHSSSLLVSNGHLHQFLIEFTHT